jgi:hypothetical protein
MEILKKIGLFLVYVFAGIGVVEVSNLGFYLMNQSNTYLFYLGLAMVLMVISFVVLTIVKFGDKGISKVSEILKSEKEENKSNN